MDKWITVEEAARIMEVDTSLVRRYAKKGIVAARKFGKVWQVSEASAKAFVRQRYPRK